MVPSEPNVAEPTRCGGAPSGPRHSFLAAPESRNSCQGDERAGDNQRNLGGFHPMYFTITTASGGYRARAYGNNGEQMMISEVYTTKQSAKHAIEVIKSQAATADVID